MHCCCGVSTGQTRRVQTTGPVVEQLHVLQPKQSEDNYGEERSSRDDEGADEAPKRKHHTHHHREDDDGDSE